MLAVDVEVTPLTALRDGTDGGNGLYRYGSTPSTFPNGTYNSENYWVDVVFQETAQDDVAPALVDRSPAPDAVGVPAGTTVSVTYSEPIVSGSATVEVSKDFSMLTIHILDTRTSEAMVRSIKNDLEAPLLGWTR